MPVLIINHQVADYDAWLPYFEAHAPARQAAGFHDLTVHRAVDDPNQLHIIGRCADAGALKVFFENPELRAVMQLAGVQGAPVFHILDDGQQFAH